jgi:hypothetical protein
MNSPKDIMHLAFEISLVIPESEFFTCRKILHGADGFTAPIKKVLWIFIALRNLSSSAEIEQAKLGTNDNTLTITPPLSQGI